MMPSTAAAIAPETTPYLPTLQERRYLDLREAGHSIAETAAEVGVSADMVKRAFSKLRGLGVPVPEPGGSAAFWSDDKIAHLRKLAGDGVTSSAAAEALGATRGGVLGKAKRLEIRFDPERTRSDGEDHRAKKGVGKPKPAPRPVKVTKPPPVVVIATPKPRPAPPPAPVEALPATTEADAAPADAITIHELRDHRCHWPFGDPRDEGFRYCGAPVARDREEWEPFYCAGHRAIAYTPAKGRGR